MHDRKSSNRKFILIKIGIEWLLSLAVGLVLFMVFKDVFNIKSGSFKFALSVILIVMLYKGINRYKGFMEGTGRSDLLFKAKSEPQSKVKLERYLLFYEESIEIQKQKLNNLKVFSPIPIIIVSVEYFTNVFSLNVMKLFSNITSFNLEFDKSEWLALVLFGVVIYYANIYITTWQRYKSSIYGYYEVKRHLLDSVE